MQGQQFVQRARLRFKYERSNIATAPVSTVKYIIASFNCQILVHLVS